MNALFFLAFVVGQVGQLMGGSSTDSGPPPVTFAILTEAGSPLTTEASSMLVTEDAP